MKKMLFIICCLFLFHSLAFADWFTPNGNDWNSWGKDRKTYYTLGFFSGVIYTILGIAIESHERSLEDDEHIKIVSKYSLTYSGISISQLVDGLDLLYTDFKNRRILIRDGIHVVKNQLIGVPTGDIERILLWLRAGRKAENKAYYLAIKDNEGKILRMIEFP